METGRARSLQDSESRDGLPCSLFVSAIELERYQIFQ